MNVRRGDVVLVLYPFASGMGGSRRPALIVQNDADNLEYNPSGGHEPHPVSGEPAWRHLYERRLL